MQTLANGVDNLEKCQNMMSSQGHKVFEKQCNHMEVLVSKMRSEMQNWIESQQEQSKL